MAAVSVERCALDALLGTRKGTAMNGQRLDDQPGSTIVHGRDGTGIGTGVWLSLPWWLGLGVLLTGCWQ